MSEKHFNLSYIPELDGIRGIAILLVMIFHIGTPLFKGGFIGVDIFFVLSGFLITTLLLREFDKFQKINLKNFYTRRILRLAPALLIILIILTLFGFAFFQYDMAVKNLQSSIITLFYSSNWVRAFNLHEMGLLNHTWSLSIEEQFYILYPCILILLLKFCRSRERVTIILIIMAICSWVIRIILTFYHYPAERIYNGLDTRADSLLTGCILGMILSSRFFNFENKTLKVFVNYTALAAILFFFTVLFGISWSNKHVFYWVAFFVQVFTALLILHVFMLNGSLVKRILRKKPLVWIGSISYGLYLWHDPIFELIRMQGYSKWIIAIFGITITFLVSSLSFYLVEKPILRFKSKFTPNSLIQKKSIMNISENKKVPSEEETYSC